MLRFNRKHLIGVSTFTFLLYNTFCAQAAIVPDGVELAKDQSLVFNNIEEPTTLDPNKVNSVYESNVARNIFETLTILDNNGKVVGGTADSWENQDFKVWTFHIREDAKWSNGQPVTAGDFVYSWRRLVDPATASQYASYLLYADLLNVEDILAGKKAPETLGVKAIDDHTLQLTLASPVPYIPKLVGHASLSPVYQPVVEKYGIKWTQPQNIVSNGAYNLAEWKVGEKIKLVRNPMYWNDKETIINEVTMLPVLAYSSAINMYRSSIIEMGEDFIPAEQFNNLKANLGDEIIEHPHLCVYYYDFNNNKPPLNDVRVRTALKLGLDTDIIASKIKKPAQTLAYTLTPLGTDGMQADTPEWFNLDKETRYKQAQDLLEAAGYNSQHPLKLTLKYNTNEEHKAIAVAAAAMWKKNIGVNIELINEEFKILLDDRDKGNYEIARGGWCADYNEPSSFLNIAMSSSSNNYAKYNNPTFDSLMSKALTVKTDEERSQLYKEAEAILDKDSPFLPLYHYISVTVKKPYIGGYTGKDVLSNFKFKDYYIIKH